MGRCGAAAGAAAAAAAAATVAPTAARAAATAAARGKAGGAGRSSSPRPRRRVTALPAGGRHPARPAELCRGVQCSGRVCLGQCRTSTLPFGTSNGPPPCVLPDGRPASSSHRWVATTRSTSSGGNQRAGGSRARGPMPIARAELPPLPLTNRCRCFTVESLRQIGSVPGGCTQLALR